MTNLQKLGYLLAAFFVIGWIFLARWLPEQSWPAGVIL